MSPKTYLPALAAQELVVKFPFYVIYLDVHAGTEPFRTTGIYDFLLNTSTSVHMQ
jgi:hypothetical protein